MKHKVVLSYTKKAALKYITKQTSKNLADREQTDSPGLNESSFHSIWLSLTY